MKKTAVVIKWNEIRKMLLFKKTRYLFLRDNK